VVVTYRPVGGEFRTLDLALPEEKAEALFEFLTNPERFDLRAVRLWTDRDGWTNAETLYPEPRKGAAT
jgi:hypothetical protein